MRIFFGKKGLSVMIGYVLLVSAVIFMSILVYAWMKSYVPVARLECPEGVSVFIKDVTCTPVGEDYELEVFLKNNGRFNIGGYFITATTGDEELATLDFIKEGGTLLAGEVAQTWLNPGVQFRDSNSFGDESDVNPMKPEDEFSSKFKLTKLITSIEITPIRWQSEKNRLVTCSLARTKELVTCP